ncbi:hypothetical protein HGRIS_006703 [Hohenbuehelia grisea]|uniref:SMODS and SLOG-associating 2TM effector domain-containing protein n=1 Tax=Hohenbuehelia grisea TaxID=104357 RepID=A0ABR3J9S3_9AGAR
MSDHQVSTTGRLGGPLQSSGSSGSSVSVRQTSKSDFQWHKHIKRINEALDKLQDEFEEPSDRMRRELTAWKVLVSNLNALIVMSIFVAGVQAQILASTSQPESNKTKLQMATNWFGFVGLTLDILGTSTCALVTIRIQSRILRTECILDTIAANISRTKARFERHREAAGSIADSEYAASLESTFAAMQKQLKYFADVCTVDQLVSPETHNILSTKKLFRPAILRPWLPRWLIQYGLNFLILSVILFAASSQVSAVWITGTAVTAAVYMWAVCLSIYDKLDTRTRRQTEILQDFVKDSNKPPHHIVVESKTRA